MTTIDQVEGLYSYPKLTVNEHTVDKYNTQTFPHVDNKETRTHLQSIHCLLFAKLVGNGCQEARLGFHRLENSQVKFLFC